MIFLRTLSEAKNVIKNNRNSTLFSHKILSTYIMKVLSWGLTEILLNRKLTESEAFGCRQRLTYR